MRSVPMAMTWEMLWRGRWRLIVSLLGAISFQLLMFVSLESTKGFSHRDPGVLPLHVMMLQLNMLMLGTGVIASQGDPKRLFAYPLRNASLAAGQMLPAMALAALMWIISTTILNQTLDLGWPIWGPALLMAVAIASLNAVQWWSPRLYWLIPALCSLAFLLAVWHNRRYGPGIGLPTHLWTELTTVEVLTMLATAICAYSFAVASIGRSRRGDAGTLPEAFRWVASRFDRPGAERSAFRSTASAQFWHEWRQKGWALPAVVLFGYLFFFGMWLLFSRNPTDLYFGAVISGLVGLVASPVIGIIVGNFGRSDAHMEMSSFMATRPMTTRQMTLVSFQVGAGSTLLSWGMWITVLGILFLTVRPDEILPVGFNWWYTPAILLGSWLALSSAATIAMAGRSKPIAVIVSSLVIAVIVQTLFARYYLSPMAQQQLARCEWIAACVAICLGTVWAYRAAFRQNLVDRSSTITAAVIAAVLVLAITAIWVQRFTAASPLYFSLLAGVALLVAPLAAAPLALEHNRTR